VAHRVAEVERATPTVASLACKPRREFARQRKQRLLQPLHLFATGVHELHVFRQGFTQRLGHRLCPAVGDESTANFGFDFFLELLDALFVLVFRQALFETRHLTFGARLVGLEQFRQHVVEV